jgi:hypothetical protein
MKSTALRSDGSASPDEVDIDVFWNLNVYDLEECGL